MPACQAILYPVAAVPERWRPLLRLNPFATFFSAIQSTLFFFRPVSAADWLWMSGAALVALVGGGAVYELLRDSLAEQA